MSAVIPVSHLQILRMSIYRFDPSIDDKPYMQDIDIEVPTDKDIMVLDALHLAKVKEPSLSYRSSCREGVCGSDGMNINGKNGLACITPLSEAIKRNKLTLRPMPGLPVIRDLIVDMKTFFNQLEKVQPYLITKSKNPEKERVQSPQERESLDGLYECILCGACSTACPSFWWNPDKFLGPAALLQSWRFIADSRDEATEERLDDLEDSFSLYRCHGIMNCVSVCPKGLNPTKAISNIRNKLISRKGS
jgi:succinate dehydrogenase / fumarate reductase iron-sulfur subunit|tara:strand:- start:93 stop:836 length:744 start_codon:yes stop_codon:yes gene_type:complete